MIANTVEEVLAALKVKFFTKRTPLPTEGSKGFCFDILVNVSRSFALVIAQLPEELRDSVCIFYLVLRALDTVEDDTKFDKEKKIPLLESFYSKMESRNFSVHGIQSKKKDEVKLLEEFPKVIEAFLALDPKYQAVIKDITKKMGAGMAEFISRDVVTVQDYDLYCHYVAGLVGHGLTDLFACSGLETINPAETRTIANSMGLFLQKVNITRDYFEDIEEDRIFWPKAIWEKHATDIKDFKDPKNIQKAVYCLNEMVVNTLDLVPDVLEYCSKLKHQQVFTFCALPQVMAIATLAEVYNNPDVFRKNVKIRKGLTARLTLNSKNMNDVGRVFYYFACKIEKKIDPKDPNATIAKEKIERIKQITKDYGTFSEGTSLFKLAVTASLTAAASVVIYQKKESILNFFSRYLGKKSQ